MVKRSQYQARILWEDQDDPWQDKKRRRELSPVRTLRPPYTPGYEFGPPIWYPKRYRKRWYQKKTYKKTKKLRKTNKKFY